MVGMSARRRASTASGRQASKRDAPNARSVSVLSWFSLQQLATRSAGWATRARTAHSSSFRIKLCKTKTPPIAFPHSIPMTGTMCHHTRSDTSKSSGGSHCINSHQFSANKDTGRKGAGSGESVLTELFWCPKRKHEHRKSCP